jgi:hypothetical protein
MEYSIVDFAYKIIEMDRTIKHQEKTIKHLMSLRDEYFKFLDNQKKHNDENVGNIFKLLLNPNIVKLYDDSNNLEED